jgi:hypothetical protein
MAGNPLIAFRASPETKAALHALARQRQLSDSALLQKLVELALLQNVGMPERSLTTPVEPVGRAARLYVRLRPDDHVLLRERAQGRGLATATYASMVLRAHLRAVSPLPDRELTELRRSIASLGMIGRNLNQLARIANSTGKLGTPLGAELRALLKALEALRDHVKALVIANVRSWESGHDPQENR